MRRKIHDDMIKKGKLFLLKGRRKYTKSQGKNYFLSLLQEQRWAVELPGTAIKASARIDECYLSVETEFFKSNEEQKGSKMFILF